MHLNIRYLVLSVLIILSIKSSLIVVSAQKVAVSVPDSSVTRGEEIKNHALFAGAGYGSNLVWLGSTITGNHPYYSLSLTYGFKSSLFLTASASQVSSMRQVPCFYLISSGYNHTFNKWLDISASLSGYKARQELQDTLFSDFGYANFTAGFDWKILYTRLSLSGIASEGISGYIAVRNSRYFQTGTFLNENAYFSFNPEITILTGKVIEIVSTTGTKKYGSSAAYKHYKKNSTVTTETPISRFGLIDFELSLPIGFNYKDLMIELEPGYIIPAYKMKDYPVPDGFSVYLSAYFRIF